MQHVKRNLNPKLETIIKEFIDELNDECAKSATDFESFEGALRYNGETYTVRLDRKVRTSELGKERVKIEQP